MKLLWSIMALIVLGLQYRLWVGEGSYSEVWLLQSKVQQQLELNQHFIDRNNRLDAEVIDLKNGYEAIEERARLSLGMIGRDETFFMVVNSTR